MTNLTNEYTVWVDRDDGDGTIQDAIDTIAGRVIDGDITGGVVKLHPKKYAPPDTIILKSGVVLEGARPWPQGHGTEQGPQGNDKYDAGRTGTVITTENLNTVPADQTNAPYNPDYANVPNDGTVSTHYHFDSPDALKEFRDTYNWDVTAPAQSWFIDNSHPHYPLVKNQQQANFQWDTAPSATLSQEWGDGVGIRNLTLEAPEGSRRYWDPADLGANVDEGTGANRSKRDYAYYFGVYDGLLIELAREALVDNIRVKGFRGYNGFYQDFRRIISRGNYYGNPGSATDHHGSTLQIGRQNSDTNIYMRGQWSLRADGPTPTAKIGNHARRSQFVTGAQQKTIIDGKDNLWLDEVETTDTNYGQTVYEAGNAPIVDNSYQHVIVPHEDAWVWWHGYDIRESDQASEAKKGVVVDAETARFHMDNCLVECSDDAITVNGYNEGNVRDNKISVGSGSAFVFVDAQPIQFSGNHVKGSTGSNGLYFAGQSDIDWTVHANNYFDTDTVIDGNNVANATGALILRGGTMTGSMFGSGEAVSEYDGKVVIDNVDGYTNEAYGAASVADAGTIAHGMDETPEVAWVQTQSSNRAYVSAVDGTNITVGLDDPIADSTGVGAAETVHWFAKGWSAPGVQT